MNTWTKINSVGLLHQKPKKHRTRKRLSGWKEKLIHNCTIIKKAKNKIKKQPEVAVSFEDAVKFYETYEWKRLRYATLKKYERKCMCCGSTEGVFHVDHIKPLRRYWNLRLDPNNVQVLCADCNRGKGNWDETDFRLISNPT